MTIVTIVTIVRSGSSVFSCLGALALSCSAAESSPPTQAEVPTQAEGSREAAGPEVEPEPAVDAEPDVRVRPRPYEEAPPMLELTARLHTGSLPKSVEVTPDGEYVLVANFGYENHNNVWRWSTAELERAGRMTFVGNAVESLFTADGAKIFVSSFSGAKIIEADGRTLRFRRSFKVGNNPKVMALSPDEALLWVANWSAHTISLVDLRRREAIDHHKVGFHPRGMVVDGEGQIFVNAMYSHQIHVLRHEPGAEPGQRGEIVEVRVMPVCEFPRHVVWSVGREALVVSCSGEDRLAVYDPATGEELDSAPVGTNPRTIAGSSDGRYVAVANFDGGSVSIVDTRARTSHEHPVPGAAHIVGVAVQPSTSAEDPLRVYATNWQGNELLVFDAPGRRD